MTNIGLIREVVEVLIGVVNSREDYHLQETIRLRSPVIMDSYPQIFAKSVIFFAQYL